MTIASARPKNSDSAACFNVTKDRSRHRVADRWRLRSVRWHTRSLRANAPALSDTERNGTVAADIRVAVQRLVSPVPSEDSAREACIAVAIAFFGGALGPSLKDTAQASRHGER